MEGHLQIKEDSLLAFSTWKLRWVVISDGIMSLYKEPGKSLCGRLHLKVVDLLPSSPSNCKFSIFSGMKKIAVRASSLREKRQWMKEIESARGESPNSCLTIPSSDALQLIDRVDSIIQRVISLVTQKHSFDVRQRLGEMGKHTHELKAELAAALPSEKAKPLLDRLQLLEREIKGGESSVGLELQMIKNVHEAMYELNRTGGLNESMSLSTSQLISHSLQSAPVTSSIPSISVSSEPVLAPVSKLDEINHSVPFVPPELADPMVKRLLTENPVFLKFPIDPLAENPRRQLPFLRDPEIKLNIWKLVKDNLGKDFTKVVAPVNLSEPLSLVQKPFESFEYIENIKKAAVTDDPTTRMMLAFTNSFLVLANSIYALKKPFNSLLGETYEYVAEGVRGFAEQVSHHPPIVAYHIRGEDFEIEGNLLVALSLTLSRAQLMMHGTHVVRFKRYNEMLVAIRPAGSINNIIFGKMYMWFVSPLSLVNEQTGARAFVEFLPRETNPEKSYQVKGKVVDRQGKTEYLLHGRWDRELHCSRPDGSESTLLGAVNPVKTQNRMQFYYTEFVINLNHLTAELAAKLPRTDSRFRPDLRAYEYGDDHLAEMEKTRLEAKQRAERKKPEGKAWKPRWFEYVEVGEKFTTRFTEQYWKCRESGQWPESLPSIYL